MENPVVITEQAPRKLRPATLKRGEKFQLFQKIYARCPQFTPTEIALMCYDCKNKRTASVLASQNLIKMGKNMKDVLERIGETDEVDAQHIARLKRAKKKIFADGQQVDEDDDHHVQIKAIELSQRLKGNLKTGSDGKDQAGQMVQAVRVEIVLDKEDHGKVSLNGQQGSGGQGTSSLGQAEASVVE